jgi:ATP-dependent RNA helicase RhlE
MTGELMSETTFRSLGVSAPVADALAERGITTPFEIQGLVVPDAMAGQDVLAKAPTGSGKTLAFGIPLVERLDPDGSTPAALVLVPTRELAAQVGEVLEHVAAARGLRVATAYGGVGLRDQAKRAAKAHLVVATPGRLEDLASRRMLSLDGISAFVLDEADRMLDMGFQPQVDRIVRRLPAKRQTMFFSATLDGEVGRLARAYTNDPARHEANPEAETVEEVDHQFVQVTPETKVQTLVDLLKQAEGGHALVFVRTRRGADRLLAKLRERGVAAVAMHGDMTQSAREKAWARFESGKVTTLVATDVAARGLDLHSITHVINFDPPEDNKGYVHRVGRTGRAGRAGTGVTLVTRDQQADVSRIAARLDLSEEFTSSGMKVAPPRLVYTSRKGRPGGRRRGW